jgi:hypothetical protein
MSTGIRGVAMVVISEISCFGRRRDRGIVGVLNNAGTRNATQPGSTEPD